MPFVIDDIAAAAATEAITAEVSSAVGVEATTSTELAAVPESIVAADDVLAEKASSLDISDNVFVDEFPSRETLEVGMEPDNNVFYDEYPSDVTTETGSTKDVTLEKTPEIDIPKSTTELDEIENVGGTNKELKNEGLGGDVNPNQEVQMSVDNKNSLDTPFRENLNSAAFKDYKNCPLEGSNGHWEGERGDSKWCPAPESTPLKNNPENKTWGDIMKEFDINGIDFNEGEPDFSEVSKGEITLDGPESDRGIVFNEADTKLAQEKNCEPWEVAKWRKDNGYTWHEKQDCITVQKVPSIVHGNVTHLGGHAITTRTLTI